MVGYGIFKKLLEGYLMKILVVSSQVPAHHAQWLMEETKSFIKDKDADILVYPHKNKAPLYGQMKEYYGIENHNLLIFNPVFNSLNEHNKKIDGTKFNSKSRYDFLITKEEDFNLSNYDVIYHIFYSRYIEFNSLYKVPSSKQFVHFYPMKYLFSKDVSYENKEVHLITTQKYITDWVGRMGHKNIIEVLGGTFLQKNHTYSLRPINNGKLKICFSSLKSSEEKGSSTYIKAAERYKLLYPNDHIEFITVGSSPNSKFVTQIGSMTMEDLKILYDSVDVYVNPHRGGAENGWPLGVEAMLRGSVLITTDMNNTSKCYPYSKSVIIIERDDVDKIVDNIKKLYDDRVLLNKMSNEIQKKSNEFYSYENQQQKIFDYIDKVMSKNV